MFKGYSNSNQKTDAPQAPASSFGESSLAPEWGASAQSDSVPESYFGGSDSGFGSGAAASAGASAVSTRNVLNSDVSVVGVLRFTDDLLVDGSVEGEITSDGVLTVGANAAIQAGEKNKVAVRTRSAIIHGRVTGDVVVTDRVELTSTAELVGDVTASKISIQEGAVFIGHCMVGVASAGAPALNTPSKKTKGGSKAAADDLLG
ncbi:MAG: polymer-forming cytoskeletal protein [Akkermansia sp.]|nr:polymer-forming cytoskeletal protein [Akkermansia sp.]MDO4752609.1 polymer-forming cytoskeletal protein [Akkermansia sp.]